MVHLNLQERGRLRLGPQYHSDLPCFLSSFLYFLLNFYLYVVMCELRKASFVYCLIRSQRRFTSSKLFFYNEKHFSHSNSQKILFMRKCVPTVDSNTTVRTLQCSWPSVEQMRKLHQSWKTGTDHPHLADRLVHIFPTQAPALLDFQFNSLTIRWWNIDDPFTTSINSWQRLFHRHSANRAYLTTSGCCHWCRYHQRPCDQLHCKAVTRWTSTHGPVDDAGIRLKRRSHDGALTATWPVLYRPK